MELQDDTKPRTQMKKALETPISSMQGAQAKPYYIIILSVREALGILD